MLVMIDLDNTLADRSRAFAAWAAEFCRHRNLPDGSAQWLIDTDGDGYADRQQLFEAIRHRFDLDPSPAELLTAYRRRVIELAEPTAGAVASLAALRRAGHTIAIVSNGSSEQQHAKIDALGLAPAVDAVIVSGDLGIEKPDRRIFEAAAERADASLDGAWMVGDSPVHDIAGAAAIGLRTAWLHRGRTWTSSEAAPTVTLGSLGELATALATA